MPLGQPWGRAASEHRPGVFIKEYLEGHGSACAADILQAMKQRVDQLNYERALKKKRPLKKPTYHSFSRYFHFFKQLGYVEPTGRTEPSQQPDLQDRVFFGLTAAGSAAEDAWLDPAKALKEIREG